MIMDDMGWHDRVHSGGFVFFSGDFQRKLGDTSILEVLTGFVNFNADHWYYIYCINLDRTTIL